MKKFRCLLVLLLTAFASGQTAQPSAPASQSAQMPQISLANSSIPRSYALAPGDQLSIRVANSEDFNDRTFRIDTNGFVVLPLVGSVKAGGLTAAQIEADLVTRLKVYFREPLVSVTIVQYQSAEPIFLVGQFKNPGFFYPLQNGETLVQIMTASGGLQPNASRALRVTRRKDQGPIPLPGARTNMDGSSTVEIALSSLRNNEAEDIVLRPYDVVLADRAEVIYVNGDVAKPGTIEVGERDFVTLVQVVTLSGGLTKDASRKVRILRPIMDTARRAEINIDMDQIYKGEANDFPLLPNDVLFVPHSGSKAALGRTETILIGLGIAIATSLAIGLH
jgi:polysaccharide biosynthesis/export protein